MRISLLVLLNAIECVCAFSTLLLDAGSSLMLDQDFIFWRSLARRREWALCRPMRFWDAFPRLSMVSGVKSLLVGLYVSFTCLSTPREIRFGGNNRE